jgi:DNA-binding CsgD family transcriptional regulator
MTDVDEFPTLVWFSQADALAHLHEIDASADVDRAASDLLGCHERLLHMGFHMLNYGAFEMIGRRVLRIYSMSDLADISFSRLYWKHRLYESDPRFAALWQSGLPATWQAGQVTAYAERTGDSRARMLSNSLRSHEMNAGLTLGLPAPQPDLRVAVNLTSRAHEIGWINDRTVGGALTIALTVHRIIQPYIDACVRRARELMLSADQAEVLERLVKGLSDQEIATATTSSLHKVASHVRALQKMFGVENRAQLVYRAARWGWER